MTKFDKIALFFWSVSVAGMGLFCCAHKGEKSIHPENDDQFKQAALINPPHDRCKIVGQDLFTYLYLDTDGDKSTFEYVAADVRNISYNRWIYAMEYKEAIESLEVGEIRSLNQWRRVAPNIVRAKFWRAKE